MRIYYDTEFIDDGRVIDLISIGMVAEDGRELYAINANLNVIRILQHPWLRDNVAPFLPIIQDPEMLDEWAWEGWNFQHPDINQVRYPAELRSMVSQFIKDTSSPELWAWYGSYDHVALAQIFGPMVDLPPHVPMFTRDLKQEHDRLECPNIPRQKGDEHHALADARWNKEVGEFLLHFEFGKSLVGAR